MSTAPSPRMPTRFVPTLTEVVEAPPPTPSVVAATVAPEPDVLPAPAVAQPDLRVGQPPQPLHVGWEDAMVQRVMQRLDAVLELRLREAVARVTQEHARALEQHLRQEMEPLVRHAVHRAIAAEVTSLRPES